MITEEMLKKIANFKKDDNSIEISNDDFVQLSDRAEVLLNRANRLINENIEIPDVFKASSFQYVGNTVGFFGNDNKLTEIGIKNVSLGHREEEGHFWSISINKNEFSVHGLINKPQSYMVKPLIEDFDDFEANFNRWAEKKEKSLKIQRIKEEQYDKEKKILYGKLDSLKDNVLDLVTLANACEKQGINIPKRFKVKRFRPDTVGFIDNVINKDIIGVGLINDKECTEVCITKDKVYNLDFKKCGIASNTGIPSNESMEVFFSYFHAFESAFYSWFESL